MENSASTARNARWWAFRGVLFPAILAVLLVFYASRRCAAHTACLSYGVAEIRTDGQLILKLHVDFPAYLLNDTPQRIGDAAMNELLDGPPEVLSRKIEEARRRLERGISLQIQGDTAAPLQATLPTLAEVIAARDSGATPRLPLMMEMQVATRVGPQSRRLAIRFPETLGDLMLEILRPGQEEISIPVIAGEWSEEQSIAVVAGEKTVPAASRGHVSFSSFVRMGFHHIMPTGLDHMLFVLGLFLLQPRRKILLLQISLFTLAHSLTLALALYGVLRLAPAIIEPLIAVSILLVAVENLWTDRLSPWRGAVIFIFGLIHGMGFAGALLDLGLARRDFLRALVGFNLGVEGGQLSVVLLAMLTVGLLAHHRLYRRFVVQPGSALIGVVALFWLWQRCLGPV